MTSVPHSLRRLLKTHHQRREKQKSKISTTVMGASHHRRSSTDYQTDIYVAFHAGINPVEHLNIYHNSRTLLIRTLITGIIRWVLLHSTEKYNSMMANMIGYDGLNITRSEFFEYLELRSDIFRELATSITADEYMLDSLRELHETSYMLWHDSTSASNMLQQDEIFLYIVEALKYVSFNLPTSDIYDKTYVEWISNGLQ